MKEQRTHDHFYIKENRYEKPKSSHIQVINLLKKNIKDFKNYEGNLFDFGCATGEFIYLLKKSSLKPKIKGFDILQPLIDKAKIMTKGKNISYSQGDVRDKNLCPSNISDFTFLIGVLPIFDKFDDILDNLIKWTKKDGVIYVHSLFNKYPVDVYTKYNYSKDYGKGFIESGWNQHSRKSVSNWLKKIKM